MHGFALSNAALDSICRIIAVKFGVHLSLQQAQALMERQPDEVKIVFGEAYQPTVAALDRLVESVSEAVTGMGYPTQHSTPYYKEYFKKKLNEHKAAYFGPADIVPVIISISKV